MPTFRTPESGRFELLVPPGGENRMLFERFVPQPSTERLSEPDISGVGRLGP